ncbi:MAG TPA: T9SS type A sorting domain-containing protein [Lentimicrobium sp.]|nr:T9SS type A sorting domain-containing protein [Lentimicrobium sp.]
MEKTFTLAKPFQWFLILIVLMSAFISSAQITITSGDMPKPGLTVIRAIDTASTFLPGGSGTNQTWDFAAASVYMFDTAFFSDPAQLPGGNLFPEANLAEGRIIVDPEGTLYNYLFWNNTSNGYYAVGWTLQFSSTSYNFNSVEDYDPDPVLLPFPLNYGDESSSTTTGTRYSSTRIENFLIDSSMVISHITATITADGSGTLITPVDSYEVLRVNETSTHVDSTYTWTQGTGWTFDRTDTYETVSYSWIANDYGEVANLSIDGTDTQFQYLSSYVIGVKELNPEDALSVYPNPAGDVLFINSPGQVNRIEIYNLSGQLVLYANSANRISIGHLEKGLYVCNMISDSGTISKKFLKQ